MIGTLLLFAIASTATVTESNTGVAFDMAMEVGAHTLHLTGVDRRRALGRDAYAVAHYMAEIPLDPHTDADARLNKYIEAPKHKVLIFHGVYKSVPAHGIRHSWRKHFSDLSVPPHDDFVNAFQAPFARGERLYFIANPEGRLEVRHDDRVLGEWNDPALVRALWAMCLGSTSELVDRRKLAALSPLPEDAARRETDKEPEHP